MATTLKTKFTDSAGKDLTVSFSHADASKSANVKPLMQGMIANGGIYANAPVAMVSADFITTTTIPVSL